MSDYPMVHLPGAFKKRFLFASQFILDIYNVPYLNIYT